MGYFDPTGVFIRDLPKPPDCEYTAQGSTTEAVDCWEPATHRHLNADGVTIGVFCPTHKNGNAAPGAVVKVEHLTEGE